MTADPEVTIIPKDPYYETFQGHEPAFLQTVEAHLRKHTSSLIILAGDSSMDNKHWVKELDRPAVGPYETLISPPEMKPDLTYHLTDLLWDQRIATLNCAVEASTVADRAGGLLPQDIVLRDRITMDDVLIVSVGCNDIALRPSMATKVNMGLLVYANTLKSLQDRPETCWGMSHFIHLFRNQVQSYLSSLVEKTKPRVCLLCTIYYPDETPSNSWAEKALTALNYTADPERLQAAIRAIHRLAISEVRVEGLEIVPVPLFEVMNGKVTEEYVCRVEPSDSGGRKMALLFQEKMNAKAGKGGETRHTVHPKCLEMLQKT
ncbi:hypothetical protein HDU67_009009 [Dinochytrium kinnereticum]|nr:hypothetical protein HDU67_009009 [Dinochytrium kinnereticum]